MKPAIGWVVGAALLVHVASHVAIAIGFARERAWTRAAVALVIAPLAPVWGWELGMRRRVVAWAVSLALYALGVAVA